MDTKISDFSFLSWDNRVEPPSLAFIRIIGVESLYCTIARRTGAESHGS